MMERWKEYERKKVFIETRSGRKYSGIVDKIEITDNITWIYLTDKFGNKITFANSEIVLIAEEKDEK